VIVKYALNNGNRVEAVKGSKGVCSNCGAELIAKCGQIKIHHWAHKGDRNCDPWWENQTEWHRSWKNNYPANWQENIFTDKLTGEKHIADIRTIHGLVIEFQHSHINLIERIAREKFYKTIVWVVDGTRLKRDYPRFLKEKTNFIPTNIPGVFRIKFIEECFPTAWVGSSVLVVFDFKGTETIDEPKDFRNHLYCLLPREGVEDATIAVISRKDFIDTTTTGSFLNRPNQIPQLKQKPSVQNLIPRREFSYVYDRGRFIKRRRF
jgi:competence protein CoiA